MPWYLLPVKSQIQVCSAMHMIQNGASLTIGPFSKLNMETATDVSQYLLTRMTFTIISFPFQLT